MAAAVPDVVPGTIRLIDTLHHTTHNHDIVLNPRPSADPEDPLNWKPWRKQLNIWMVYTYIFGVAIATAVQYSVLTNISEETGISVADLNTGTGLMFLFLGWVSLLGNPTPFTLRFQPSRCLQRHKPPKLTLARAASSGNPSL